MEKKTLAMLVALGLAVFLAACAPPETPTPTPGFQQVTPGATPLAVTPVGTPAVTPVGTPAVTPVGTPAVGVTPTPARVGTPSPTPVA